MPEHHSPKRRDEIVAEYRPLAYEMGKSKAAAVVGSRHGISGATVARWARTKQPKDVNNVSANYPAIIVPGEAKVELTQETTMEVFLSDLHFHPEPRMGHDEAAWAATERALEAINPDIVYFGGDICDMYAPSRYEKIPRLATPEAFDAEVEYCKKKLSEIRTILPNARYIWLTGNHELRLPKGVQANAPWLYNRLENVESLLELSNLGIEFVNDGHSIGKLKHYHGHNIAGSGRVNTAKNKFERMLTNFIFGHHHKFSKWLQRDQDGSYFGAYGNGTIQYLEVEYAMFPDWTQGFSTIQYSKTGRFHVDQILIHKPSVWSQKAELIYAGNHIKVDLG